MIMKSSVTAKLQGILIVFLILINGIFLIKIINRQKNVERVKPPQDIDYAIRSLSEAVIVGYKTEGLPVNLRNNQDSLFLLTLIHNKALILRISDTHCEACTTEALSDLLGFSSDLNVVKVILTNYINSRSIEVFKTTYPDFFVFNEESVDLPIERINTPYLFIVDRSMLTDMVFVHQKEFPEKTKGYFEALKNRFEQ